MTEREARIRALTFSANILSPMGMSGNESFIDYSKEDQDKIYKAINEVSNRLFDQAMKLKGRTTNGRRP
jgi:hypothetical protein